MNNTPEPELQPVEPQSLMPHHFEPQHPGPAAADPPHGGFFFGRFGLRAGWGISIFFIVWFLLNVVGGIFGLATTGQFKPAMDARVQAQAHPHAAHPALAIKFVPAFTIVTDSIIFLPLLGLCWFFSKGERRPLSAYGIGRNRWKDIFAGALSGFVLMSLLIALLWSQRLLVFDGQNLHGASIAWYGAKWLLAFLFVGLAEEYGFRGYVQYTLMRGLWGVAEKLSPRNPRVVAFWTAATVLSILFARLHMGNEGETPVGIAAVFVAGMAFAYTLWRTGSLWWGIGFHMAWDWAQSFFYGVPDSGNISVGRLFSTHYQGNPLLSGGSAGPEGSAYVIVAFLLTIAAVHLTPKGTQPPLEQAAPVNEALQGSVGLTS